MIYVLEDEPGIQKLICYALQSAGQEAEGFALCEEFKIAARNAPPSLAILDLSLPDGDGLDVLRWLRRRPATAALPVLLLSARDTEFDKVTGLDAGADDYLAKPFGMLELCARVKSLLRRAGEPSAQSLRTHGALSLNPETREVTAAGESVVLSRKEFDVLLLLLNAKGGVRTRDQLMTSVWGIDFDGESRTVDVHIRSLRQKLGECGALVETVRGVGYRLKEG